MSKPLIDLYRAVCEAWPEMTMHCQPANFHPEHVWVTKAGGTIGELDARLICGAAWAEEIGKRRFTQPTRMISGSIVLELMDDGLTFVWCDYGDLNQMYPIIGTGHDLCEAAANALVALAKEKRP